MLLRTERLVTRCLSRRSGRDINIGAGGLQENLKGRKVAQHKGHLARVVGKKSEESRVVRLFGRGQLVILAAGSGGGRRRSKDEGAEMEEAEVSNQTKGLRRRKRAVKKSLRAETRLFSIPRKPTMAPKRRGGNPNNENRSKIGQNNTRSDWGPWSRRNTLWLRLQKEILKFRSSRETGETGGGKKKVITTKELERQRYQKN